MISKPNFHSRNFSPMFFKSCIKVKQWAVDNIEPISPADNWKGITGKWEVYISGDLHGVVIKIEKDNPIFSIAALSINIPDVTVLPK